MGCMWSPVLPNKDQSNIDLGQIQCKWSFLTLSNTIIIIFNTFFYKTHLHYKAHILFFFYMSTITYGVSNTIYYREMFHMPRPQDPGPADKGFGPWAWIMMRTIRLLPKPKSSVLGFLLRQTDSRHGLKPTLCTELDNEKLFYKTFESLVASCNSFITALLWAESISSAWATKGRLSWIIQHSKSKSRKLYMKLVRA